MLSWQRSGAVATVTMSRPPANAWNEELVSRFETAFDEIKNLPDLSVMHLRSDQKIFCAGADLAFMRACFSSPEGTEGMVELVRRLQRLFARIEESEILSLAEIGGAALGGGLELALSCDLRMAAMEAKLGLPEVRLGLLPGAGGTQRLARLCGHGIAKRVILGAEIMDGAQAERLGIVQWSCPRPELAERAAELASHLAGMPKAALAGAKRCIAAQGVVSRDGFSEEIEATRMLYNHPESRRRVAEFLEKS